MKMIMMVMKLKIMVPNNFLKYYGSNLSIRRQESRQRGTFYLGLELDQV